MIQVELVCEECFWSGFAEELVSETDDFDDIDYIYCPNCGGTEFDEEEQEIIDA